MPLDEASGFGRAELTPKSCNACKQDEKHSNLGFRVKESVPLRISLALLCCVHLSIGTSDLKQNGTQELAPFSSTVLCAFARFDSVVLQKPNNSRQNRSHHENRQEN